VGSPATPPGPAQSVDGAHTGNPLGGFGAGGRGDPADQGPVEAVSKFYEPHAGIP
jgi:hypothetical protein